MGGDKCWYLERKLPDPYSSLNPIESGFSIIRSLVLGDSFLDRSISCSPTDHLLDQALFVMY